MKHLLIAALLTSSSQAFAKQIEYFFSNSPETKISFFKKDGFLVSQECERNCAAINATKAKPTNALEFAGGNPAAVNCSNHNATSVVLRDQKGNQNSFCKFDDGSMIDAWDLYYQFNPKD